MDVVGDIMTKKVITCAAEDSLLEIQKLLVKHRISRVVVTDREKKPTGILTHACMTKNGISGLPVVNNAGKLFGIVTKSDLTEAVASLKE